ncbi:J domain-containing protein [Rhizobium halophytocola]|uniref:DnaJ-class molecular chaperone n=1 Tax=Rhizobium halophytocola TaxID=735519 RepID=A0ABS4DXC6_9HYPH|nr:DnaJ C-terminal domain-containing protein [Rhizobium halophytocola]MBP1850325.1 DnaJ-class molecular chaperone [Rhizobium halophytocola]
MRDPYSILGLKQTADTGEIKAAWRKKAKSLHPDANRDDPDATQKFAEAGKAYEVLKDPAKRTRYDTLRAKAEEQGQTIMQQRQAAREAEERARAAKIKAEAVLAELARAEAEKAKAQKAQAEKVQAEQAKTDKTQTQKPQSANPQTGQTQAGQNQAGQGQPGGAQTSGTRADTAQAANSQTGQQAKQPAQPQAAKAGADAAQGQPNQSGHHGAGDSTQGGARAKTAQASAEDIVSQIFGASPEAQAAAESLRRESADEDGSEEARLGGPFDFLNLLVRRFRGGPPPEKAPDIKVDATVTIEDLIAQTAVNAELPDGRDVRVALDGGLSEGDTVRLKAQGLKLAGMTRGDVVATIRVKKSDRFRVDGLDIRTVLPVTLENAVLGFDTTVETPTGRADITVPAWSGSDQVVTLEGQGLPDGEGGRGDLKVELSVILWEKPDEKVTDLMRLMREGLYL